MLGAERREALSMYMITVGEAAEKLGRNYRDFLENRDCDDLTVNCLVKDAT